MGRSQLGSGRWSSEVDITSKDGINIPVGLEPGLYRLQELVLRMALSS